MRAPDRNVYQVSEGKDEKHTFEGLDLGGKALSRRRSSVGGVIYDHHLVVLIVQLSVERTNSAASTNTVNVK